MKSKVYFTHEISSEKLLEIYKKLGVELKGKVAVKVHSGEKGNQNYLKPLFYKDIIDYVKGTVVECNTAYDGARNTSEKHLKLLEEHEWSKYYNIDLLDKDDELKLPVKEGKHLKVNYVGKNIENYDSMLVLSHFKGHPMGGFGGSLKNLSIGLASSHGKANIHGAGNPEDIWTSDHDSFLESMAEADKTIMDYEKNIAFINVMANMSVDCDCCAVAEDPCMKDIGILASLDPVAIDKACLDLVYAAVDDPGQKHFLERVESRHGVHTVDCAAELGAGTKDYELIEI